MSDESKDKPATKEQLTAAQHDITREWLKAILQLAGADPNCPKEL